MKTDLKALLILITCALLLGGCGSPELEEANTKLTDENKTLKKEKGDLEKEVETLKAEAETVQTQITTLQTSLDEMTKKVTAQADEVNFYIDTNAVLEQEKTELQDKLNAANDLIAQLQANAATAPPVPPSPTSPVAATTPVVTTPTLPTNTVPAAPPPPTFPPTDPVAAAATSVASEFAPAVATPPAATPTAVAPAVTEISPDNPLVNPVAGMEANLAISLYIVHQGQQFPLANTEIYITEKQPNVTKWGFHLKDKTISANQLAQIQQSLATSIIHKRVTTDEAGNAQVPTLKAGTYWVSCANPATRNGLQWSVQHTLSPGANQLVLSNGNILQ